MCIRDRIKRSRCRTERSYQIARLAASQPFFYLSSSGVSRPGGPGQSAKCYWFCNYVKQLLQSLRSGEINIKDVPAPTDPKRAGVLVRVHASLISAGTEKMKVDLARAS